MAKGYRMAKNEVGNKYGKLLVIERDNNGWDRTSRWKCKCDCGNIIIVRGTSLRSGNTKSCGCLNKFPFGVASFNAFYARKIKEAKRRGLEWNLSKDEVKYITSQNCFYCGNSPSQIYIGPSYNGEYVYNGMDRINNHGGYHIENIVPCCWVCNRAKAGMTSEEFKSWAISIYSHWASH